MKGDSYTVIRLMEMVTWLESRSVMLDRLLFAVETKYPDESRFDTAFRYIREAESRSSPHTSQTLRCTAPTAENLDSKNT